MSQVATYDIALHGTSLTARAGVDWQVVFKGRMLADASKVVRIYDKGVSGANSAFILGDAEPCLELKPWAAVIEAGANDVFQSVPIATYTANMLTLINEYKSASPATRLFLMTMNPFVSPPVPLLAKTQIATYYQAMRDLQAATPGVSLIDVFPEYGSPTTFDIPDGVHPTLATQKAVLVPKLISTFSPLMV